MKRLSLALLALMLAVIAGLAGFYMSQSAQRQPSIEPSSEPSSLTTMNANGDSIIGTARPDFSLTDVAGETRNISEWDGKVIAINFWATWCPPCIKEIPEFIAIQQKYQAQGLQFIGIALQRAEEVTEFMQTYGMNYPVLAGEMEVIKLSESYGNDIGALPYTVIIDRQGLIHFVKRGPLAGDTAEAIIAKLL